MDSVGLIVQILSDVGSLALPFGLTFGGLLIFLWSLPLLPKLLKSIF